MTKWTQACSLAELGAMTAQWLLGDVPKHPCQDAPPDDETREIAKVLIRLNRSGFFTDFSQPAEPLKNGFAQRAAVSGFCTEPIARKLAGLGARQK